MWAHNPSPSSHSPPSLSAAWVAKPLPPSLSTPLQKPEGTLNLGSLFYTSEKQWQRKAVGVWGHWGQFSSKSVQCSCGNKRAGQRQPRGWGGRWRLGPVPRLTSSNSESSSFSLVPVWDSLIRSPHSNEFLQLPRKCRVGHHKPPPGQALGAKVRTHLAWAWSWGAGHPFARARLGWGRGVGLTQGIGPLGAKVALAPLEGIPLRGRSRGPLQGSQDVGNTEGFLHPVRDDRQVRKKAVTMWLIFIKHF